MQGETAQLAQRLAKTGRFSTEQQKLLPELLDILVQQHQQESQFNPIKDWFYQLTWQAKPRRAIIQSIVPTNPWLTYKSMTCVSGFGSILPLQYTSIHFNIPCIEVSFRG